MMEPRPFPRSRQRGTTLLELLVVMTIVSVLLGIGVGVFGKLSMANAANNSAAGVRALVRVIRDHAKNHGTVGTMIVDVKRNRIVGLLERAVGQWHFEKENIGAFGHDPDMGNANALDPDGCIGGCLRLEGAQGGSVVLGNSSTFESDWGVSLSADIYLPEETSGGILSKGDAYGLRIGTGGTLEGWVGVAEGPRGSRPEIVDVDSGEHTIPLGRWVRVGLYYDRVEVRVFIDYRPVGLSQERRPLAPDRNAPLRVGGAPGAFNGKIDGVRLGVLGPGEGGEMPAEVKIKRGTPAIRFNADGFLDPLYHTRPALIVLEGEDGKSVTVVVGLMGDVTTN